MKSQSDESQVLLTTINIFKWAIAMISKKKGKTGKFPGPFWANKSSYEALKTTLFLESSCEPADEVRRSQRSMLEKLHMTKKPHLKNFQEGITLHPSMEN